MTNCPEASAVTSPATLPPSRSLIRAPGAARPATTVSPVGSTRTTSKAGIPGRGETAGATAEAGGGVPGSDCSETSGDVAGAGGVREATGAAAGAGARPGASAGALFPVAGGSIALEAGLGATSGGTVVAMR
jgi:hypothetical protein